MTEFRYQAFLSYSHRDERWAAWLHRALETYAIPKQLIGQASELGPIPKRLAPVFRDREELPSATDLNSKIAEALEQSATQIVICSPHAARSRWVNEEILCFKRLGREHRIFCVIVDGEPNATEMPYQRALECFPEALRFRLGADGQLSSERTEPIAADARPGKDGKTNSLLKLIAGMLGVGFDSLRRREIARRHRRLALMSTGAFAGMVITTGLAGFALIARENAERERQRAESEAETAHQTTAFLIDLFRISDPGEARGNTVTAREMLDKGAARIQTELVNQPAVQATLMDTVGTVYMRLGLYNQAQPLLEHALQRRRALLAPSANALKASLNNVGELQRLRADYAASEKTYREALRAANEDNEPNPVVGQSLYGLAEALSGQGRFVEAEQALRQALALQKKAYSGLHPDIANTTENLALAIFDRGDLKTALPLMEKAVAMQRKLHAGQAHPDLAEALNNLMFMVHASGDYDRAEYLLSQSIQMKTKLLGDKHPEIANGLNNLASMAQDRGEYARAESLYFRALTMQEELLGRVHPDVAQTLSNLATLLYDKGNADGALRHATEALEILRKLFPGDHPTVAATLDQIGYWLLLKKDLSGAREKLESALAMRLRLFGENHVQVAASRAHWAMLQVARHQYDDALESARESAKVFTANLPPGQWRTALAESVEGAALAGQGQYPEAEKMLLKSYDVINADAAAWPIYKRQAAQYLRDLYIQMKRPQEAQRYAGTIAATRVAGTD
ncbi:MAG: toll/interleukin-1 receptor domain-containing protein [Steroidobacteraceae bacterium]